MKQSISFNREDTKKVNFQDKLKLESMGFSLFKIEYDWNTIGNKLARNEKMDELNKLHHNYIMEYYAAIKMKRLHFKSAEINLIY